MSVDSGGEWACSTRYRYQNFETLIIEFGDSDRYGEKDPITD